jgi:hypothetical protein
MMKRFQTLLSMQLAPLPQGAVPRAHRQRAHRRAHAAETVQVLSKPWGEQGKAVHVDGIKARIESAYGLSA